MSESERRIMEIKKIVEKYGRDYKMIGWFVTQLLKDDDQ